MKYCVFRRSFLRHQGQDFKDKAGMEKDLFFHRERKGNMYRDTLKKTLACSLSAVMALGTSAGSLILPVMAEETLPDPAIIPKPLSYEAKTGAYTMGEDVEILVMPASDEDRSALQTTADLLAARLRRSTGYEIPVVEQGDPEGNIVLKTNDALETLGNEGYNLESSRNGVQIEAYEPAGVYNATQTLRQMFPSDIEKQEVVEGGVWKVKAASISDKPEYEYRGMHLDVSRHFFTVDQVKRQIDLISQFKINKLHMHLSDDQGWRLEIKNNEETLPGWDLTRLKTIGAATSCSTNGINAGQYTQEEFKDLIAYAAARNIEIIPEFDMPAHAWAALVSLPQLNSTEDGLPHAGNYDNTKCYEGLDVGWASLETRNENTYKFIDEVVRQVAAISPSPIIHLGGDEAHSTSRTDYSYFMNRVVEIGNKYGKTVMGWENLDEVIGDDADAVTQFWSTGNAKMTAGRKYVCSVADHAYMDMKYDGNSEFGLSWATYNPTDDSYNWDPTNYGTKDQILGVEACLWTETIATDYALDYMIYPRIAGHAEIGWTPKAERSWNEYKGRIAQYDTRLINEGVQLRRDEIIWPEPYVPVNAHFSLDEGEGNTVSDSEGAYTATVEGNPAWIDGVRGKAFHFDGQTCLDIKHKDMQGPWSAAMWVKREASSGTNAVLLSGTEGEIKLDQWKNTGKVGLTEFGVQDYTFNYSAPLNEWVHLAFVCDESTTTLYVNGVKTDTLNAEIKGPFSRIGHCAKSGLESTGYMSGALDEIHVVNEALSADAVKALYQQEAGSSKDSLQAVIDQAEALNAADYTTESWNVLQTALTAAKAAAAKEDASEQEITEAMNSLEAAISALVSRKHFINDSETGTGLNQYNFSAGWSTSTNYPDLFYGGDEHWVNFTKFSGETMPYYTIEFEGTGIEVFGNVDSMMGIYEVTIDDGEPVDVDAYAPSRTTQSLLFSKRDLPRGRHTLKVSATERKNPASSSTDIEADYAIVYDEETAPSKDTAGIRRLLAQAIASAQTIADCEDFTKLAPAVQNLITVRLAEGKAAYDNASASFDELAEAWKNLADAIHYAGFKADKANLKARIDAVEAMDLDGYTEESAQALRNALAAAKAVYEDENALQERIDKALADLNAAAAALEETPSQEVDKSLLAFLIAQSDEALSQESKYVKDDAWTAFVSELASAKEVYANPAAAQEEVSAAISALNSAYLSIRMAPDEAVLAQLREFVALADGITPSLYSDEELASIRSQRTLSAELLNNPEADAAQAQARLDAIAPVAAMIRKREAQKAPAKGTASSASVKTAAASNGAFWMLTAGAAAAAILLSKRRK